MKYNRIAIIVAMDKELNLILPLLGRNAINEKCPSDPNVSLWVGKHDKIEIALMKCGIGKVNAALATQAMIQTFHPDLVISTGVAGGVGAAGILDVVVASRLCFHDIWCGHGTEPCVADGCPLFFTPPQHLLSLPSLQPSGFLRQGLICSGDFFVSKPEEVSLIKSKFPEAQAVEMESGAIAQTCHRNGVDMMAIRVMSDTPGADDNISQYNDFWTAAPERTFGVVKSLLDDLTR